MAVPFRAPPSLRRSRGIDPSLVMILISAGVVGTIVLGFALGYDDVDVWGGIMVPTIICSGTIPFILRVERNRRSGLGTIISLALVAKMMGSYLRFLLSYYVYDGNDSGLYHKNGVAIAEAYLRGDRSLGSLIPTSFGTQFIDELNGLVALVSGRSLLASFMVFSWFGFLGLWAIVAAVRRCLPDVDIRRYTALVLFLPSSLFWPSSLGKEAWMLLGIGLFATGAARIYTVQARGLVFMLAGVVATGMVRPHVTVLLLMAFTIALLVARQDSRRALRPVLTILTIGFVAAAAAFASGPLEEILPDQERGLTAVLDITAERTSGGGSEIEVQRANSPQDYPLAFITVMFRPLIFEVGSFTQLLSSLESSYLLLAAFTGRRRIARGIRQVLRNPFSLFALLYTLAFAFAWSSMGNLGIISRQRIQVMPFLLILFCWAAVDERRFRGTSRSPMQFPHSKVMS